MQTRLGDVATMLDLPAPERDVVIAGVSIDSRTLRAGELFVALNGPNFSGSDFVGAAAEQGAVAALTEQRVAAPLPQLVVADTRQALLQLARRWRARFAPTVIGITGSNGKTTMRAMLQACFGAEALATRGNLNNDIGVPLMVLELAAHHRYAIFEMGANHAGEIALLTELIRPQIGIVTNAGPAHLEGFGSLDGVCNAKGELFVALGAGQHAVINADDVYADRWREMAAPATITTFGSAAHADVWYDDYRAGPTGSSFMLRHGGEAVAVTLAVHGRHHALNACGAAAVALAAGLTLTTIATALAGFAGEPGRQRCIAGRNGATIIDDSYNANPASMQAAAGAAVASGKHAWMVVADMGELGRDSEDLHRQTGAAIRAAGVERLFAFGPQSQATVAGFGDGGQHFESVTTLIDTLRPQLADDICIAVKGSRAMRAERVVQALVEVN